MLDQAHRQPEEAVDLAHPLGVEARQVFVDGDDVHALARQRVQERRQRGGQRLALAGAHLGDAALMQHDGADHLRVERALAQRAHRRLAHQRVGFGQQLVQILAALGAFAQFAGIGAHLLVGELLHLPFKGADLLYGLAQALDLGLVGAGERLFDKVEHGRSSKTAARESARAGLNQFLL